jgi:acyl-CoA synthetase (AMP-forming)/AMP-acid ligase II
MQTLLGRTLDWFARDRARVFARVWDRHAASTAVSYGDLVLRAAAIARRLQSAGVRQGDVVVVILKPDAMLLSAWLAPLLAGAIPSLFPWPTEKLSREFYERSVSTLLGICGATALVTSGDLLDTLRPLGASAPQLRSFITVDDITPDNELPAVPRQWLDDPERITILQHSSGSTGLQKGIALSSRAVINQIETYAQALRVKPTDRIANWMPLYHDGGLIAGFVQPLVQGLELSILSPMDWVRDPVLLLRAISTDRATLCWLPNFAYAFMATRIPDRRLEGIDLSSMRAFINTAEPVRVASHERFFARFAPYGLQRSALTTSYGTAENTLAITQSDPDRPLNVDVVDRLRLARDGVAAPPAPGAVPMSLLSSGPPIPGTALRVLDADLRELGERRVGEFAIRSQCMLTEYFRRPDITAQAFHEGWYLTGDYGYLAGGEVYVTGRKKDLIIVAGNNIYPQDLEFIADNVRGVHPGRTVAFGLENESTGTEDVVVIVEAEAGADAEQVQEDVRAAIAHQSDCTARTVYVVPPMWLIKTSSGKISRTRCKAKFLEETAGRAAADIPSA